MLRTTSGASTGPGRRRHRVRNRNLGARSGGGWMSLYSELMRLRDYQIALTLQFNEAIQNHRMIVIACPTGYWSAHEIIKMHASANTKAWQVRLPAVAKAS